MKKGFTIVELLGVLLLIGLLSLIVYPVINGLVSNNKEKLYENQIKTLLNIASNWAIENRGVYDENDVYTLTFEVLKKEGYIKDADIINPKTNKTLEGCINIFYNNPTKQFVFEYSESECKVQIVKDESNASVPNLHDNMIPIKYDGTKWVKADKLNTAKEWFDYENLKWANAVTVTQASRDAYQSAESGTPVLETDILTYMVWIPRYEYKIEGLYGKDGTNASNPGEIEVNFKNQTSASSGYIMHPGFKFGSEELMGFWIGKFETSTSDTLCNTTSNVTNCNKNVHEIRIKPNMSSLRYITLSNMFNVSLSLSNNTTYGYSSVEAHMLKNSEWGAVAYLSQSKYGKYGNASYTGANKEIYQNKSSSFITGNSNGTPGQTATNTQCPYNDHTNNCGIGASTTGNIYGVYDMSGGSYEYVMGNYNKIIANAEFASMPESKYYDLYITDVATTACGGICYGQALSETTNWYGDYLGYAISAYPWVFRGGDYLNHNNDAGIFYSFYGNGNNNISNGSFRIVHK